MIALLLIFILLTPAVWAGEKGGAQLKVQMLQERVWRLEAQWQLMQRALPEAQAELEAAKKSPAAEVEKKKAEALKK